MLSFFYLAHCNETLCNVIYMIITVQFATTCDYKY